MREVDWDRAVVASLANSKAAGWDYEHAKRVAVKAFPAPRERSRGGDVQLTLVDDGVDLDYEEIGHAEFFWMVARQAYEDRVGPPVGSRGATGNGPDLRHFTFELIGDRDDTTFARVGRNRRAA